MERRRWITDFAIPAPFAAIPALIRVLILVLTLASNLVPLRAAMDAFAKKENIRDKIWPTILRPTTITRPTILLPIITQREMFQRDNILWHNIRQDRLRRTNIRRATRF